MLPPGPLSTGHQPLALATWTVTLTKEGFLSTTMCPKHVGIIKSTLLFQQPPDTSASRLLEVLFPVSLSLYTVLLFQGYSFS